MEKQDDRSSVTPCSNGCKGGQSTPRQTGYILVPKKWWPEEADALDHKELAWWYTASDEISLQECQTCKRRIGFIIQRLYNMPTMPGKELREGKTQVLRKVKNGLRKSANSETQTTRHKLCEPWFRGWGLGRVFRRNKVSPFLHLGRPKSGRDWRWDNHPQTRRNTQSYNHPAIPSWPICMVEKGSGRIPAHHGQGGTCQQ